MILNEKILYRDNHHLNIPGSILIGKMLSNQLNKILSNINFITFGGYAISK